ncbi:hypothetical protein [Acinetobacter baumannii]|uniref:hypothetical protein n=1 Tax=Acinetobacter baumannii TaxID=470 RepID=UPI001D178967|nr:hypothetical protein [Acinetobacter baumannii]
MDKSNKEILQAFMDWFMREYSNFGGKPIAERYEEAFDTFNNDFIDARYDAFQDGWKAQQAKVEELQKQLSEYIFVTETIDEMYVKEVQKSDELQKRVDAMKGLAQTLWEKSNEKHKQGKVWESKALGECADEILDVLEQALKGEG